MEKIEDKIKKLIAKAESAEKLGNQAEAELFAMKAQEMAIKYAIDLSNLKTGDREKITLTEISHDMLVKPHEGQWILELYSTIAQHNFGYMFKRRKQNNSIMIVLVAEPSYSNLIDTICQSLMTRIRIAALTAMRETRFQGNRNAFKRAFFVGAVRGINAKLTEQMKQKQQEYPTLMPVLLDNKTKIQNFINENLNLKAGRASKAPGMADAKVMGFRTGKDMSISRGNLANSSQKFIG